MRKWTSTGIALGYPRNSSTMSLELFTILLIVKIKLKSIMGNVTSRTSSFLRGRGSRASNMLGILNGRGASQNLIASHSITIPPQLTTLLNGSTNTLQSLYDLLNIGIVHIFNQERFNDIKISPRYGTEHDVKLLQDTFIKLLSYEINIHTNFSLDEIKDKMSEIETTDYSHNSCVIIIILSHGTEHEVVLSKDQPYYIKYVIERSLFQNQTLQGKPKILFVQACKGSINLEKKLQKLTRKENGMIYKNIYYNPAELIKFYSTYEDYVSYRNPFLGSVFIRKLCAAIDQFGYTISIFDIFRHVQQEVATETDYKQIPSFTTTVLKPFFFGNQL